MKLLLDAMATVYLAENLKGRGSDPINRGQ